MRVSRLAQGVAGAALIALPFVYRDPYHLHLLILILIWSFAYTSWSMMGRFGLVSLGHGGFMGVGAYVTALLWNHLGVSPWIGIPVGMAAAGVLALIVAYPCFRFRITGHYFVLVTLALSGIVLQVITATRDYTGGSLGYTPDRTRGSHLAAGQFHASPRQKGGAFPALLGRQCVERAVQRLHRLHRPHLGCPHQQAGLVRLGPGQRHPPRATPPRRGTPVRGDVDRR